MQQQQQRNTRGELLRLPFVCYDYENNAVYLLPPFQAMLHAKITGLSPTRWMYKNLLHGKCQNVISNKRIEIYNRVWFHLSHNQVHLCSKFQPLIWLIFIFSLNYIYTSIYIAATLNHFERRAKSKGEEECSARRVSEWHKRLFVTKEKTLQRSFRFHLAQMLNERKILKLSTKHERQHCYRLNIEELLHKRFDYRSRKCSWNFIYGKCKREEKR